MKHHERIVKAQHHEQVGRPFCRARGLREVKPHADRLRVTDKARRGLFGDPHMAEHENRPKWLPVAAHGRVPGIWSGRRDYCTQPHASLESVENRIESILKENQRCKRDAGIAIVWKSITILPEAVTVPSVSRFRRGSFVKGTPCQPDEPRRGPMR